MAQLVDMPEKMRQAGRKSIGGYAGFGYLNIGGVTVQAGR
jgi:hypothetical protein